MWTVARPAFLSMGFPRQEYRSGYPFPSPGNLPDPGTTSPESPELADGFFTTEPPGKPAQYAVPNDPQPRNKFWYKHFYKAKDRIKDMEIYLVRVLNHPWNGNLWKVKDSYCKLENNCSKNKTNPEETKIEKDTYTPLLIAALFTIARTWKQPSCPMTDECIKKLCTYTQWNIIQP